MKIQNWHWFVFYIYFFNKISTSLIYLYGHILQFLFYLFMQALRVSMEEQRQRQEDEARRAQANEAATNKPPETIKEVHNEEAMLKRALAMSLEGAETSSSTADNTVPANINAPDFARMTEEEQIAFAMQMSMQDQREIQIYIYM